MEVFDIELLGAWKFICSKQSRTFSGDQWIWNNTFESPSAMKQKKKVLRESSRCASLSLYPSLGICFGHSQWHTRPAKLWANPVGLFSHSQEHSLHTSLPKLFCSIAKCYVPLRAWTWSQKGFCLFVCFQLQKCIQECISLLHILL